MYHLPQFCKYKPVMKESLFKKLDYIKNVHYRPQMIILFLFSMFIFHSALNSIKLIIIMLPNSIMCNCPVNIFMDKAFFKKLLLALFFKVFP